MDRKSRILSYIDAKAKGLEIGAFHNPIAPKCKGYNVEILDHACKEDLIKKIGTQPLDASKIEEVDYVWQGEALSDLIKDHGSYSWIIASHVVEHIPDLVGFFQECKTLLKPDGVLSLAVPDKRYCFDFFRGISSSGQLYNAHLDGRVKQKLGDVFDHYSFAAKKDDCITWPAHSDAEAEFVHDLDYAMGQVEQTQKTGDYNDVHMWQFTPSSFRLILMDLKHLGLIDLVEDDFYSEDGFEFFISLKRKGRGCPLSRIELARQTQAELARSMSKPLVEPTLPKKGFKDRMNLIRQCFQP